MTTDRILIFWEDGEDIVKMFSYFLREHGIFVDSVNSFDECVEFCINTPPGVLLIARSPFQPNNALLFIEKLRSSNISYFPIIMGNANFTSDGKVDGYHEGFAAGANACFGQVFDINDVLQQIKTLIANPTTAGLVDKQHLKLNGRGNQKRS